MQICDDLKVTSQKNIFLCGYVLCLTFFVILPNFKKEKSFKEICPAIFLFANKYIWVKYKHCYDFF